MGFFKALILLLVIPAFGYGVGVWALSSINSDLSSNGIEFTVSDLCTSEMISQTPELVPLCNDVKPILWMQNGSIASGVAAMALLLFFIAAALFAGENRARVSRVFPPLVFISLLFLSILVLVQGVILTYGAYLAESTAINRVHFVVIGGIGFGAFAGSIYLIKASFNFMSKKPLRVLGTTLVPGSHPEVFSFIKGIAEKLGARPPEHIVVGLEPNFYVTSSKVHVLGENKHLSGETLFLSLPLARILNKEEFSAVIGHELGHFRGQDTYYSMKFSPVYTGLTSAISLMDTDEDEGFYAIARIPALVMLSFMMDLFHKNISAISRKREFEADLAATEIASAQALGTSLLKISLYAHLWENLQKEIIHRLENRKFTRNMSRLFSSAVQYDINKEALPGVVQKIAQETISHPTDSHPPTAKRLENLEVELAQIDHALLSMPASGSIELIKGHELLEEALTSLQQKYYASLGVQIPEEEEVSYGAILLAALGAYMVLADGKVESEEIDRAEEIGREIIKEFDSIDFREYCHYPDSLPAFEDLLSAVGDLAKEGKRVIYVYLERIAESDGKISPEEEALLLQVKASIGNSVDTSAPHLGEESSLPKQKEGPKVSIYDDHHITCKECGATYLSRYAHKCVKDNVG